MGAVSVFYLGRQKCSGQPWLRVVRTTKKQRPHLTLQLLPLSGLWRFTTTSTQRPRPSEVNYTTSTGQITSPRVLTENCWFGYSYSKCNCGAMYVNHSLRTNKKNGSARLNKSVLVNETVFICSVCDFHHNFEMPEQNLKYVVALESLHHPQ